MISAYQCLILYLICTNKLLLFVIHILHQILVSLLLQNCRPEVLLSKLGQAKGSHLFIKGLSFDLLSKKKCANKLATNLIKKKKTLYKYFCLLTALAVFKNVSTFVWTSFTMSGWICTAHFNLFPSFSSRKTFNPYAITLRPTHEE